MTTERVPRRAPLAVWITALVASPWASVTLLLFCPLGALFVLFGGRGFCQNDWEGPACEVSEAAHIGLALAAIAIVISGVVLSVRLIRDPIALPTGGGLELRANRITAMLGAVHHAAVLAWAAAGLGVHDGLAGALFIAVPCAIGMLVALVQWRASAHLARALR